MREASPNLDLLLLLGASLGLGGRHDGGGGRLLDDLAEFLLLLGEPTLEADLGGQFAGLSAERDELLIVLGRAILDLAEFGHASGDRGGSVLQLLEIRRHDWPAPC